MKLHTIALLASLPFLMGQANNGCTTEQLPTVAQVELYLPSNIRTCPNLPVSPGKTATRRQTAVYILALYSAAKACKGNLGDVDALYAKYRVELERVAAGG